MMEIFGKSCAEILAAWCGGKALTYKGARVIDVQLSGLNALCISCADGRTYKAVRG